MQYDSHMPPVTPPETPKKRSRLLPIAAVATVAALAGGGVSAAIVSNHNDTSRSGSVTTTVKETVAVDASSSQNAANTTPESRSIADIYKDVNPGVVKIDTTLQSTNSGSVDPLNPFGPGGNGNGTPSRAEGTGFVIDTSGNILTNYHVIKDATKIGVHFPDGSSVEGKLVGEDSFYDVALIHVDEPAEKLHPLPLGTTASMRVGDPVIAIGNPLGYDNTVTAGIISALHRSISSPDGSSRSIPSAIQTDASINHGNSGGPLINARGEVIGINSQITDRAGIDANIGIGFAIPIDTVKGNLDRLKQGKSGAHPFIGIQGALVTSDVRAKDAKLPETGVIVDKVFQDSPAAAAGLTAGSNSVTAAGEAFCLGGDVITRVNDAAVTSMPDLQSAVQAAGVGNEMKFEVVDKDGKTRTVTVKVADRPANPTTKLASGCKG